MLGVIRGQSKASLKILGGLVVFGGLAFYVCVQVKEHDRRAAGEVGVSAERSAPTVAPEPPATAFAPMPAVTTDAASTTLALADAGAAETLDRFAQREAIEAALAQKDVSALPALEQTDLAADGYVAASAIDAVGKLAAIAPEPAKGDAVRTLARWLDQESKRKTNDAAGNVAILVESLADTKSKDAIAPLAAALDAADYPLSVQTSMVQSLDGLDARTAEPSVARFLARVQAMKPADDLERELTKEAATIAQAVLAKWHAGP
jgi:hypothetical protein